MMMWIVLFGMPFAGVAIAATIIAALPKSPEEPMSDDWWQAIK
jgi:hypothetical protein